MQNSSIIFLLLVVVMRLVQVAPTNNFLNGAAVPAATCNFEISTLTNPSSITAISFCWRSNFWTTMRNLFSLAVSLLGLASLCQAKSSAGDSVLVLLEPQLERKSFSTFFDGLEGEDQHEWVKRLGD